MNSQWILYLIFGAVLSTVIWMIRSYAKPHTKTHVILLTVLSWFFCFGAYAVFPIDIYLTLHDKEHASRNKISSIWKILYWGNFFMCWIVLPLIMEYEDAGDFTIGGKIKRSIKINLMYYGLYAALCIPILGAALYYGKFNEIGFWNFLAASSNSFCIFFMIICLGFSLYGFPQSMLQNTDHQSMLKKCQYEVSFCSYVISNLADLIESEIRYVAKAYQTQCIPEATNSDFKKIIEAVPYNVYSCSLETLKQININVLSTTQSITTYEQLVKANKRIMKYCADVTRLRTREYLLRKKAIFIEDLVDCKNAINPISSPRGMEIFRSEAAWNTSCWKSMVYRYHIQAKPLLIKFSAGLFIIMSAMILFCEVLGMMYQSIEDWVRTYLILHDSKLINGIWFSLFIYTIFCVHFSIFRFKIAGFYNLYSDRQTDPSSLLYSGINFSRVSFAICLNFLELMNINDSSYNNVMGSSNTLPIFGESFQKLFPITLLCLVLFNIFNVYGRVMKALGMKDLSLSHHNVHFQREGNQILKKEAQIASDLDFQESRSKKGELNIKEIIARGNIKTLGFGKKKQVLNSSPEKQSIEI